MAAIVTLRVYGARNLPIMDSARNTTDAYVLIRLGDTQKEQTRICYNSLDPIWDEGFRFKLLDEAMIYETPLQLTVFDKDTFSANDPIGTVVIHLGTLLSFENSQQRLVGWFPIYDTLKGIVGNLYVNIRLQRIAGISLQFFSASSIENHDIIRYHGFIDELIVSADPEHRWQGLISGARKTNESRQLLFYKMEGQVQRSLSRKATQLGGNAVIGYRFEIDFEGSHGVIARGYGTACTLRKKESEEKAAENTEQKHHRSRHHKHRDPGIFPINRRSPIMGRSRRFAVEFLTVEALPPEKAKFLIGGAVNARSIKLLTGKRAKQKLRDDWWDEIRAEMRSHAASLQCSHILGYKENTTIFDDVCVLSASGTAIRILSNRNNLRKRTACQVFHSPFTRRQLSKSTLARCKCCSQGFVPEVLLCTIPPPPDPYYTRKESEPALGVRQSSDGAIPRGRGNSNIRPPKHEKSELPLILRDSRQLVEARVCRQLPKLQGEARAMQVSESILFLQYDLYRQLIYKLRVLGLNTAFGLTVQLSLGENLIVAVATATACYATALPPPQKLRISRHIDIKDQEDRELVAIQNKITKESAKNFQYWQKKLEALIKRIAPVPLSRGYTAPPKIRTANSLPSTPAVIKSDSKDPQPSSTASAPSNSEVETKKVPEMSPLSLKPISSSAQGTPQPQAKPLTILAAAGGSISLKNDAKDESSSSSTDSDDDMIGGDRRKFVLHVDDEADEDIMAVLLEPRMIGFINTPLQNDELTDAHALQGGSGLLTFVKRVRIGSVPTNKLNQAFAAIFLDLYASLQYKSRGFACNVQLQVNVPEEDQIEIVLMAVAIPQYLRIKHLDLCFPFSHSRQASLGKSPRKIDIKKIQFKSASSGNVTETKLKYESASSVPLNVERMATAPGIQNLTPPGTPKVGGERLLPPYKGLIPRLGRISRDAMIEGERDPARWGYTHVQLSTLERLPKRQVVQYLGRVSVHLIRESFEEKRGTLARFTHELLAQINTLARAHVAARGGNSLLSYTLLEYQVDQESTRQSYSIMSLSGDAVLIGS